MTKHVCPEEIAKMFSTEEMARTKGRAMAIEWAKNLDLAPGDLVWLPEIGWSKYEPQVH